MKSMNGLIRQLMYLVIWKARMAQDCLDKQLTIVNVVEKNRNQSQLQL